MIRAIKRLFKRLFKAKSHHVKSTLNLNALIANRYRADEV
jgi:hypothetical protein